MIPELEAPAQITAARLVSMGPRGRAIAAAFLRALDTMPADDVEAIRIALASLPPERRAPFLGTLIKVAVACADNAVRAQASAEPAALPMPRVSTIDGMAEATTPATPSAASAAA